MCSVLVVRRLSLSPLRSSVLRLRLPTAVPAVGSCVPAPAPVALVALGRSPGLPANAEGVLLLRAVERLLNEVLVGALELGDLLVLFEEGLQLLVEEQHHRLQSLPLDAAGVESRRTRRCTCCATRITTCCTR